MRSAVVRAALLGVVPLVGGLAGVAGCRAVLGIDPLPPEADGGSASGRREGGADAADGRTGDAGDGGDAHDAGPTFCQKLSPKPTLCADFDEGDFKKGWDNDGRRLCPGTVGGGTISADTARSFSAPRSFLSETPALVSSTTSADAVLVKQLPHPGVAGSLSIDLQVYVDSMDIPSTSDGVLIVDVFYGATVGAIALMLDSTGLELGVLHPGPPGVILPVLTPFPTGEWVDVELLITNAPSDGGPDGLATADARGKHVDAVVPASFQTWGGDPVYPLLSVGASAQGPVGAFRANIDNVVFNLYAP